MSLARASSSHLKQQGTNTKNTTVLSQHHKYIRNHPTKPWSRTEAQDQAQEEKDKQPTASPGGEGQAQELNQEEKASKEQAITISKQQQQITTLLLHNFRH
jgi:hypothetical protein